MTAGRMVQDFVAPARDSSAGSAGGPAFQGRVRLYLIGLLAIASFHHLVILTARLALDGSSARAAALDPDALRRLALIVACAALVSVTSLLRLTRSALLWLDAAAALVVSGAMLVGIAMRPPEIRPELLALLNVTLVLVGRAALVPSTARRTLVIGGLAIAPLLIVAPFLYPAEHTIAGIPVRRLVRVTVFGFGVATLAVTAVTSQVIYRLRRSVRSAMKLGPYEIQRKIGEGGMGTVYEARHALLKRRTALKLIKPSHLDLSTEARFEREAQLTSELSHPNTVSLYDYGQTTDGIYYYAMEFVDGVTLHDLVRRGGPLPVGRALDLLHQVAASLAQAHRKGLIHRDIKPSNVMVCYREGHPDCIKVLDFGLAKRLETTEDGRTEDGDLVIGTPEFMAPEATYDTESVGAASDVYAVGVLGYFLLTGSVPFSGRNARAIAYAHLGQPLLPPSLRSKREVPADIEQVLAVCLTKTPEGRYRDGQALLRALEACHDDGSWSTDRAEQWWQAWERRAAAKRRAGEEAPREATPAAPRKEPNPAATRAFGLTRRKEQAETAPSPRDAARPPWTAP